jgi:hypothetical protein
MSFSLVETRVPGEKPQQAKLRADYFSLPLFLYLQCLNQKELKNNNNKFYSDNDNVMKLLSLSLTAEQNKLVRLHLTSFFVRLGWSLSEWSNFKCLNITTLPTNVRLV